MRIRSVLQEFEAKLEPNSALHCPGARGKAEWKLYADGTRRGKVSISRLDLIDGTVLDLVVDGCRIAELVVEGKLARYRRESERGELVPSVGVDQVIQVIHAGRVILEGRFYAE